MLLSFLCFSPLTGAKSSSGRMSSFCFLEPAPSVAHVPRQFCVESLTMSGTTSHCAHFVDSLKGGIHRSR
jgi:hypothetical protein